MTLQLQMLGTGSAFAKQYYNNNALLRDPAYTLLIDCGVTAPAALHQLNISLGDIDSVLITHIHADHVGGLEELAFRMKFTYQRKMVLYVAEDLAEPLWENTLKGGLYQEGEITALEDIFEVRLLKPHTPVKLSDHLNIELIPTKHIAGKPSYSLYINDSIFYSSDMRFDPQLLEQLVYTRSCRTILHECQLTGQGEVHTTLAELLGLPKELQRIIYLMHYGDEREAYNDSIGEMTFLEQHVIYNLNELGSQ